MNGFPWGEGVLVVSRDGNSKANFSCSAQLYNAAELDNATHTCDLEPREEDEANIHVNIDTKLVGGWRRC